MGMPKARSWCARISGLRDEGSRFWVWGGRRKKNADAKNGGVFKLNRSDSRVGRSGFLNRAGSPRFPTSFLALSQFFSHFPPFFDFY